MLPFPQADLDANVHMDLPIIIYPLIIQEGIVYWKNSIVQNSPAPTGLQTLRLVQSHNILNN